ncbi:large ribosomal subunit protein mL64 [Pogona vitticeps]
MAARRCCLLLGGVRFYNAKPVKRRVREPYRLDPDDPKTPFWQLTDAYRAKLYGRYGAASGIDPTKLWPTPEQLEAMEEEERTWYPSLREMEMSLDAKEAEAAAKKRQREELIAARMAKMPGMIAAWKQEREALKIKMAEEKAQRQRLLAEARERFGHKMNEHSLEFQEMVQEMEKAKKKELKEQRKRRREEALARKALESTDAASSPDKDKEVAVAELSHQDTQTVESFPETGAASKL